MQIQDDDTMTVNRALLSLEYTKNVEISDYLKEGDIGFKKPKTKKKRSSRRNQPEEPAPATEPTSMDVDEKPAPTTTTRRERNLDANFVDDDELQAALARSRRSKARKINKLSPEELAKRVAEEKNEAEAEEAMRNEEPAAAGLELDDTSEFVRSVTFDPVAAEPKKLALQLPTSAPAPAVAAAGDQAIESMDVDEEKEDGEADEEDDEAMLNAIEGMITAAAGGTQPSEAPASVKVEEELDIGTAAAATSGRGMAGTLKALKQQGLLSGPNVEVEERERLQKQKDTWLASHRRLLAERELARLKSRGMTKDQSAREYENRVRDQQEARETMDSFKDYKPDVELKYYDDTGRELDTKEAWKALSHRFHGKGSGRAKMEKRMKKIAEEKKRQAMIAGDTPLSMNRAFQTRQEKAGQAHMVLSVGNRGAVPQLAEFLDNRDISKSNKQADKGKKKKVEGEATPVMSSVDITSFVAPTTTATASTSQASTPPPPKMKPAFSRVTAEPISGSASPAGGAGLERGKVAFGFSVKRKAENEAVGVVAVAPNALLTGGSKAGLGWGGGGEISQFEVGKVSWYYTWSPTSWVQPPPNLEYVPMLWGGKDVSAFAKAVTRASVASNGWTHVLGMNEPQEPSQSNMSPADAANMWKTYLEPLKAGNPNLRLGSPAPSSRPNGIQWIYDFLGNCNGGCTVDFIALHYYDVNATDFIRHINEYHDAFQRPIWVTEWACQNFNNGPQCSYNQIVRFLDETQTYMDKTDWVERFLDETQTYMDKTDWVERLPNTRRQSASAPLKAGLGWGGGGNISQFEGHEVSWYFTWSPQSWVVPAPTQLEFVPQLWGERDVQTFASVVNATSIATNGWKNLLGMNEPELPAQANMAAQDGVNFWKAHLEPLKSTGIRLGSPATTSGPNGKKWMQDFFTVCAGNCTVDFLALHWYGNVAEEFIAYLEDFHNTFQRPIWITEYSCQNFVNGAQCTYEEIVQFLNTTQTYMDQTSWVEHYAWFGAMASLPNNVNQLTALMDPFAYVDYNKYKFDCYFEHLYVFVYHPHVFVYHLNVFIYHPHIFIHYLHIFI
ncbi:unnamed protein product [Rhizoctonia solani]|uniref:Asl1-like glycosyl hydrolase catalytic domain-containing protein n=1 Tax=Rhizoctonia solani TaxID=456999 RepID=A0A8H2XQR4_9AGAM|nr:unnamed protein product [Rhizoctonia solani]